MEVLLANFQGDGKETASQGSNPNVLRSKSNSNKKGNWKQTAVSEETDYIERKEGLIQPRTRRPGGDLAACAIICV